MTRREIESAYESLTMRVMEQDSTAILNRYMLQKQSDYVEFLEMKINALEKTKAQLVKKLAALERKLEKRK